ncbi:hypothetical protein ACLB2K_007867 [Fragaria x ananassa]
MSLLLDSAASYHVMNRIIKLAHCDGRTVISSIHQPSIEVFELFQNLCLLSSGRTVYFGPASQAEQFFASNGFPCPTLRNPTDYYLRTINKDFDMDLEQGLDGKPSNEEAIQILINSYKSSGTSKQLELNVTEICNQKGEALKKGNQASFITQCLILTRRSFVNMYRDLGYYWLRLGIYVGLCLCLGTIYHAIGSAFDSIQSIHAHVCRIILNFHGNIGGFPSFVEDMKIFRRERLNGHYGVAAFVVGNTFSSIPYLLMNSVIPGAIVFFLVGLQQTFDHFAYFALVLFVTLLLVESLMMIVASIVPDFLMGVITGSGILGVMLLAGGLFRKPHDLPTFFWRYPMYHIGFHKYVSQGIYKNEFEGLTFPNNQAGGSFIITGEEILKNIWEMEMSYSKWVDLAILFGMVILYRLMFFGMIEAREKVAPIIKFFMNCGDGGRRMSRSAAWFGRGSSACGTLARLVETWLGGARGSWRWLVEVYAAVALPVDQQHWRSATAKVRTGVADQTFCRYWAGLLLEVAWVSIWVSARYLVFNPL